MDQQKNLISIYLILVFCFLMTGIIYPMQPIQTRSEAKAAAPTIEDIEFTRSNSWTDTSCRNIHLYLSDNCDDFIREGTLICEVSSDGINYHKIEISIVTQGALNSEFLTTIPTNLNNDSGTYFIRLRLETVSDGKSIYTYSKVKKVNIYIPRRLSISPHHRYNEDSNYYGWDFYERATPIYVAPGESKQFSYYISSPQRNNIPIDNSDVFWKKWKLGSYISSELEEGDCFPNPTYGVTPQMIVRYGEYLGVDEWDGDGKYDEKLSKGITITKDGLLTVKNDASLIGHSFFVWFEVGNNVGGASVYPFTAFDYTAVEIVQPITKIEFEFQYMDMQKGTTKVMPKPEFFPKKAKNRNLTWVSANPNICTVDSDGKIYAKNYGTTHITAWTANGKCDTITVEVCKPSLVGFKKLEVNEEDTYIVSYTGKKVEWKLSKNDILKIESQKSKTIKLRAIKPGKATLYAKVDGFTLKKNIEVLKPKMKYKKVKIKRGKIKKNWIRRMYGLECLKNLKIKWRSKNKKIAVLPKEWNSNNDTYVYVKGKKKGKTWITAKIQAKKIKYKSTIKFKVIVK